jgi:hypothetical protein
MQILVFFLVLGSLICGLLFWIAQIYLKNYLVDKEEVLDEISQVTLRSWKEAANIYGEDYKVVLEVIHLVLDKAKECQVKQNEILALADRTHELETTIIKLKKILQRKERHV